jgi:hypothetical protein
MILDCPFTYIDEIDTLVRIERDLIWYQMISKAYLQLIYKNI